uniref:Uncharacterized threonine-rich GPI-anchored glycoprotein PJ4664.02-like n=1 Tax=Saccoglossus kowalevskii TaxID=10224 RepID=A0ABM0MVM2_SACKO|nr:PREDICTED: uncharacterized threonine-rich GPI-anchored glycoprotein PJ4664.02-like [Saccoglossus kowalevskii]
MDNFVPRAAAQQTYTAYPGVNPCVVGFQNMFPAPQLNSNSLFTRPYLLPLPQDYGVLQCGGRQTYQPRSIYPSQPQLLVPRQVQPRGLLARPCATATGAIQAGGYLNSRPVFDHQTILQSSNNVVVRPNASNILGSRVQTQNAPSLVHSSYIPSLPGTSISVYNHFLHSSATGDNCNVPCRPVIYETIPDEPTPASEHCENDRVSENVDDSITIQSSAENPGEYNGDIAVGFASVDVISEREQAYSDDVDGKTPPVTKGTPPGMEECNCIHTPPPIVRTLRPPSQNFSAKRKTHLDSKTAILSSLRPIRPKSSVQGIPLAISPSNVTNLPPSHTASRRGPTADFIPLRCNDVIQSNNPVNIPPTFQQIQQNNSFCNQFQNILPVNSLQITNSMMTTPSAPVTTTTSSNISLNPTYISQSQSFLPPIAPMPPTTLSAPNVVMATSITESGAPVQCIPVQIQRPISSQTLLNARPPNTTIRPQQRLRCRVSRRRKKTPLRLLLKETHRMPSNKGSSPETDSKEFVRRKANARERIRVNKLNSAFDLLRSVLPKDLLMKTEHTGKRVFKMSKVETLRCAISYMHKLEMILRKPTTSATGHVVPQLQSRQEGMKYFSVEEMPPPMMISYTGAPSVVQVLPSRNVSILPAPTPIDNNNNNNSNIPVNNDSSAS